MVVLTSVELNYLVFRYLQESGFIHAAFALGYEAGINTSPIDGTLVPPNALITFVQKGFQYLEMEVNNDTDADADVEEDFSFLTSIEIITKDVNELRRLVKERRSSRKDRKKDPEKEPDREHKRARNNRREDTHKDHVQDGEGKEIYELNWQRKDQRGGKGKEVKSGKEGDEKAKLQDGRSADPKPMNICPEAPKLQHEISASDVTILKGHTSEVCVCAWSPSGSLLASGSRDSTARIWTISDTSSRSHNVSCNVVVLKHDAKGITNEKRKDVTTLDWNWKGTLLATGFCDGQARIWNTNGDLKSSLTKHKGGILTLKWNKKGDYLLTGSCDRTAIVWDVKTEVPKQQFEFHSDLILDVDWRSNNSFATSSVDKMIHVCKIGENRPLKTFAGHQGEVNCVKWDPSGVLLASCSDDNSAKIWSMKQNEYLHNLKDHSKEICTIRWSPTGTGTRNPNQQLVLASASFDSTVKIWDVELGKLQYSLNGHSGAVYTVAFSPNGKYLASGSMDRCVHIWSLKEGRIVKSYSGMGGIFDVCWNRKGDKIAASFGNNAVCVIDFRM